MPNIFWIIIIILLAILVYVIIKKLIKIAFVLAVIVIAAFLLMNTFSITPLVQEESLDYVQLHEGFAIEVFAQGLGPSKVSIPGPNTGPRFMAAKDNTVYVAVSRQGMIMALEDNDGDSRVDSEKVFIENLDRPHNLAFYEDWYYIAEQSRIIRVKDVDGDNVADLATVEELVQLDVGGNHWTRTLAIIDGKLYISSGSTCNVCVEESEERGAIQECDLDGSNCRIYAKGLRNSVGLLEHEGVFYATENGRDLIGNDVPPEEINVIEEGKDYGWPICYGDKIHDTNYDKNTYIRNPCEDTESPLVEMQAHSAPLGLEIYEEGNFPAEYKGKMFVAYHGSWNRDPPTGYKVVMIDLESKEVEDFATGWLEGEKVRGRPLDVLQFRDSLLVSDDNTGMVYRIFYQDN